jgi:hypothetical protein
MNRVFCPREVPNSFSPPQKYAVFSAEECHGFGLGVRCGRDSMAAFCTPENTPNASTRPTAAITAAAINHGFVECLRVGPHSWGIGLTVVTVMLVPFLFSTIILR